MRWSLPLLSLALLACSLGACSPDDPTRRGPADGASQVDPPGVSQSGGEGAAAGASGASAGGGAGQSSAGGKWGGGAGACAPPSTSGQGGACAASAYEAEPVPVSLYLMIDRSGSMTDLTGVGPSKWDALRAALGDVLGSPPVEQLSVAAQFFPPFSGDECSEANYADPAVNLTSAASARSAVLSAMLSKPEGSTPTGPALAGALAQARLWARQRPDEAVAVVLATDGQPTDCSPTDGPSLAALCADALVGTTAEPGVATFVIGILGVNDLGSGARGVLEAIALAGGTGSAALLDPAADVSEQFSSALRSAATRGVSCSLPLPAAVDDASKLSLVNVALTTAACGRRVLSYVPDAASCAIDGWHYDVDPATGAMPRKAVLCKDSCERYRAGASVSIEVGCLTQGWTK